MIGRDRRDHSVTEPALDYRSTVGDRDRGPARFRLNDEVPRRYQAAERTAKRRLMGSGRQHKDSLARDERHVTRDRVREQAAVAVD